MNAAYIGILSPGSTSLMRAEWLRKLTPGTEWTWIDTDAPFQRSARLWRTLAFRGKRGMAVSRMNELVRDAVRNRSFDLVWLDKAVFLNDATMRDVRRAAKRMAHFTPDTAFHENRSRYFESTLGMYDLLVTTKSFEISEYHRRVPPEAVMLTTQGYDPEVHFPRNSEELRRAEAVFIGLAEPDREACIAALLENGIPVRLGGIGWQRFLRQWESHPSLTFAGEEIFGDAYADMLSRAWIGLGLLSKRFPELHTTRTFEIPACGAVLATEATVDTRKYLADDEAVFFTDYADLATKLKRLVRPDSIDELRRLAGAGHDRVESDGRNYPSILGSVLANPRLAQ